MPIKGKLGVAVNYTPPDSDLDLTLAIVYDPLLVTEVLEAAIAETSKKIEGEGDPVVINAYETQRAFLQKCREGVVRELTLSSII